MKNFKFKSVPILLLLIMISCSNNNQENNLQAPLINRDVFFGNPEISGGKISPDGKYISFLKEYNGIMNIWLKKFDQQFDQAKPLTDNERPIDGYFWTEDNKNILFFKDYKGDENYNIYLVDPYAQADKQTGVPLAKNLTPLKDIRAYIFHVSRINPDILWVGINDRDKAWHDLYKLTISNGKLELLFKNTQRITGWDFDWNDQVRLAYRSNEDGSNDILNVANNFEFKKIYHTNIEETAYTSSWNKNNTKVYLVSNKGNVDKTTLYLMDPKTGKLELIEADPLNKVDFGGLSIDSNTREVIATYYTYDKTVFYWKNKEWEDDYKYLQNKFKKKEISFTSSSKDYNKNLIAVGGDIYAYEVYYFNRKTKELVKQYTPRPKLKEVEQYLAPMKAIHYKSSDGLEIPAYLTLPYNANAKNLPLVVLVHGGPKGPRDTWGYDPYVQMLANRGYAVLQPNYRASGGYGKKFLNAGDKQWGQLMQDDITFGVKYLIDQGIINNKQICIMGGSYGGYATLAGLTFTPKIYACGVDIVGPSNLFTLLKSIPEYWEAGRAFLYEMVGDPNTKEGKALLKKASPLFHIDQINKPLLIIQGKHDPRVKEAESQQIVVALRDKGKPVTYLLADDEGHGFRKPINQKAMWFEIEKFLATYLPGRYQESDSKEVIDRLRQLKQDISKVTVNKK